MKEKMALKEKKLRKQINEYFNNTGSADENITAAVSSSVRS
jgi:hypothetical protein